MNFTQPWVVWLGWTLLHFLWQGTLIAIMFAVARAFLARSLSAHARYLLACATLGAMTIAPVLTYFTLPGIRVATMAPTGWQIPADAWQRALPWLVTAWLGGVGVFSARLIGGWRLASRMRSAAVRPAPAEWQQALEGLIARIGASRPVHLLISSLVEVPTVIGWLKPVILMPVGALTGLPPEHAAALLAHELAHIRRHDYLANILQSIAEAVLFYHPAVWWVSDQIREERELCCDDLAVAACGGDVLTYARALAGVESFRPAHADTVLAANGGSLVSRIRRLIGQAPSVSQSLPGPGAVLSLALLWLVGIGTVTMRGSTLEAAAQPPLSEPTASLPAFPVRPILSALLFDPFFEPPQAPAPAKAPEPKAVALAAKEQAPAQLPNQYGRRVDREAAYLIDLDMPMTFAEATTIPARQLFPGLPASDPNARLRTLNAVQGSPVQLISPLEAVAFETWVEDAPSPDYAQSFRGGSGDIERGAGWVTIPRSFRDDLRHVLITYSVTAEIVTRRPLMPLTYQLTFADFKALIPEDSRLSAPKEVPVPQIVQEGDAVAVELYRNSQTGQKVVDYIHVGRLNKVTLRTEAPHESYSDDAGFNLTRPLLRINGEQQDIVALPQTLRGTTVWVYLPGYGRYVASFKRQPELGFDRFGEVTGSALTFTEGTNLFRIDCAERIATGSGSYRVHLLRDPDWSPADRKDRDKAMLGALPGVVAAR